MKYLFLILIFLSVASFAQDKTTEKRTTRDSTGRVVITESEVISNTEDITPRNYMLIINPLKFFLFYNVSFYFKANQSITAGFGIQTPTISALNGFGVNGEVRWYPKGKGLRGFYVAPNFSVNTLSSNNMNSNTATITSFGVLIGWQWFPGDDFAMGLGIGIDRYLGSSESSYSSYQGNAPALRFDIGYTW